MPIKLRNLTDQVTVEIGYNGYGYIGFRIIFRHYLVRVIKIRGSTVSSIINELRLYQMEISVPSDPIYLRFTAILQDIRLVYEYDLSEFHCIK